MDFFDKIATELESKRPEINKRIKSVSFRDFQDLCFNAKKMYETYYNKTNVLNMLYCVFETYFKRIDRLPISISSDIIYPSEEEKKDREMILNIYTLLEVFYNVLDENNLIRPEIKENGAMLDFTKTFFGVFRNKNFEFKKEIVLDYLRNMVLN